MQIIITIYLMFTEYVMNMKCSLDYMCSTYEVHSITVCDTHATCLTYTSLYNSSHVYGVYRLHALHSA